MPRRLKKIIKKLLGDKNPALKSLRARVAKAPAGPGIYRWFGESGTVLYVGKAKNLRKRLTSYVRAAPRGREAALRGPWKRSFLAQIRDFDVTVADSELEALLMETNLIKELRPKYNVLMKDDKNYLFIRVSLQDRFPVVETIRRFHQDGAKYFGPYLNSDSAYRTLELLQEVLGYRACPHSIEVYNRWNAEAIAKLKPCLESQIGRCNGLCAGQISEEEYYSRIESVVDYLKGDTAPVRRVLQEKMKAAAAAHKFELAARLRNFLQTLEQKESGQLATDTTGEDSDVVGVAILSNRAHVVVLHRRTGRLIGESHYPLAGQAESIASVLEQFLPQFYEEGREVPPMVMLPEEIESPDVITAMLRERRHGAVTLLIPERGRKSRLVQLAEKNAAEKARQMEVKWEAEHRNTTEALEGLRDALSLPAAPKRIEGYDISHLGGTETVGSMVVIANGKAANDQYRNFTIHSMRSGEIDDYRALKEVLRRRLRHISGGLKSEEKQWKEKGIVLKQGKKADAAALAKFLGRPAKDIDVRAFLIAWQDKEIAGAAKLHTYAGGLREIRSLKIAEKFRGERLGQYLLRTLLKKVKKGRTYIVCKPDLESYYAEIGFRHVIKPPKDLQDSIKRMKKDGVREPLVTMYDPVQHKTDSSLSATPDLLVIDGGKGQLSAAVEVILELFHSHISINGYMDGSGPLKLAIPVIGLAKRDEDIFVPDQSDPIALAKDSPAQFLLTRLRDEAHRFANKLRETKGLKAAKQSVLDTVPGLGPVLRQKILLKCKTIDGIKNASDEELGEILNGEQMKALRSTIQ
ncbi:excinuclease ABC subunit UvrC [Candidatus Uhrbacteria bacterium]|nr:excinuclease ABC subunit UvrC [Candidatus Uhrbacteria bacterium]